MHSWLPLLALAGVAILASAVMMYLRRRRSDQIGAMLKKRQPSARLVTRAEFAEGMERMAVSLALTDRTIYYENPDFEASFDLEDIDEVEYDDELSIGRSVSNGCRVLRFRVHGNSFDFILQPGDCEKWMAALPPHRMGEELALAQ